MRQIQRLAKKLQTHHCHNPRRQRKHGSVHCISRLFTLLAPSCDFEPQSGYAGTERLADTPKKCTPKHSFPPRIYGEIEGQGHGEAFRDVVDEEGEEDGEAKSGIRVVSSVGDEPFRYFVKGNGGAGLETDGEEDIGRDMMMVLSCCV